MSFVNDINAINHNISWQTAVAMVNRFNATKGAILAGQYSTQPGTLPDYETFNVNAIKNITQQAGCVALRIYTGVNDSNEICFILVGVDTNGDDVIMTNGANALQACEEEGQRFP